MGSRFSGNKLCLARERAGKRSNPKIKYRSIDNQYDYSGVLDRIYNLYLRADEELTDREKLIELFEFYTLDNFETCNSMRFKNYNKSLRYIKRWTAEGRPSPISIKDLKMIFETHSENVKLQKFIRTQNNKVLKSN